MGTSSQDRKHVLVVGGSGMLRDVCIQFAAEGHAVSVVARTERRLHDLRQAADDLPGFINPVPLDYSDSVALRRGIRGAKDKHGPILLTICWIHSTAPGAIEIVASEVQDRLIEIRSSTVENPLLSVERKPPFRKPRLRHDVVVLGYETGPGGARWLTVQEIARGVLTAVDSQESLVVIGTVHPWDDRPSSFG